MSRALEVHTVHRNVLVVETDAKNNFCRGRKKVKIEQFPTEQVDFTLSLEKMTLSVTQMKPCHCLFKTYCKCCTPGLRNDTAYLKLHLDFENYLHEVSHNYKYKITCNWIDKASVHQQLCSFKEVRLSKFMNFWINTNHCLSCVTDDFREAVISVVIERSGINPGPINTFQSDFLSLLDNPVHSDVILRVGNESFNAHKNILSCRSPVFDAMFKCDMTEKQTGIVDISDVSVEGIKALLRYIYSGRVGNLETIASEVLDAAVKYQVDGLKNDCIEYFMFNVNLESIHDFHDLLNFYDIKELRDKISTFIKNNKRVPRKDNCP